MRGKNFLPGMDILRGVAAVLVFLFHYWTFYSVSLPSGFDIFSVGHIGVDLFFVLSGLLVTLSLWRSSSFSSYFSKRLRRIAPLAIASGTLFWLIKTDFSWYSFQDLLAHTFFIHGFFSQWYHSINPVMWSISIEMAFYLLLPLVWLVFSNKNLKTFLVIFSVLVALSFLYRGILFFFFEHWNWEQRLIASEQLWGRLDQFFFGIILACIVLSAPIQQFLKKYTVFFLFLSGIFLSFSVFVFFILQSEFRELFFGQVFLHFITAGGFFFAILWMILSPEKLKESKNTLLPKGDSPCCNTTMSVSYKKRVPEIHHVFSFFGTISYGIYLLHYPILSQVAKIVENPLIGFFVSVLGTILLSWISWEFFEKRFLGNRD